MTTLNKKLRAKRKSPSGQPPLSARLSPEQLKTLKHLQVKARDQYMADHEEYLRKTAQEQSQKIFERVNVDITTEHETIINEFFKKRATRSKLARFDVTFPEVIVKIKSALERYRIAEYFSAPSDWFGGGKDYKAKYSIEVKELAKVFGNAAEALEKLTYFQFGALRDRHKDWFIIDTGPQQIYPRKMSLVNGLRMIEEHLEENSRLEGTMRGASKSECQANLRNDLRKIYHVATGRNAPKQTTDWDSGEVKGDFVSFVQLIYEIAGIEREAGHQIKRDSRA